MPELMLKPGWPGTFRRTVTVEGKEPRTIEFGANLPVEVSKEEMELLAPEIGVAIWPIERDDKKRPRYVEAPEHAAKKGQPEPTFAEKKAARQAAVKKTADKKAAKEAKADEKRAAH